MTRADREQRGKAVKQPIPDLQWRDDGLIRTDRIAEGVVDAGEYRAWVGPCYLPPGGWAAQVELWGGLRYFKASVRDLATQESAHAWCKLALRVLCTNAVVLK